MNQIFKFTIYASLLFSLQSCDALKEFIGISETKKSDIQDIFEDDLLRECVARLTAGLQAKEVTYIVCSGNSLKSLKGLEQFPNIRALILNSNRLSQVDLSVFPNLEYLDLSANRLKEIDIRQNPKLIELFLDLNSLDELATSNNPMLDAIILTGNSLSFLDLNKNNDIEVLVI